MSNKTQQPQATLTIDGKTVELEMLTSTMGERALNLSGLKAKTGCFAYDPATVNTAVCRSAITYVDGDKGILLHRGYPIEDLADNCSFIEVAYLLIHGKLPTESQRQKFSGLLNIHSMLHEDMRSFFGNYPEGAHPMAVLSAMVVSLSSFYPELREDSGQEEIDITVTRLLSKLRTIAAFSYKKSIGEPYVYPSHKYSYCENFLNMMFRSPVSQYEADAYDVAAMNKLLILHSDHEQNASTTAVRMVGSTGANLYACISAAICALWGPLHGGANQAVIEMLEGIHRDRLTIDQVLAKAKDRNSKFRLMGFGHRIYKSYDPRARLTKKLCMEMAAKRKINDPLVEIALELETRALADDYFQTRNLYPNVDFYTGLTYRMMGFPKEMFTVLFALGRLPGWIAHWQEMRADSEQKIMRPRQIYVGPQRTEFVRIEARK
ncbi:MAG TPA: citrate synthase [Kiritimatiellia bacterium]|nr:citrate synthase [Kiritimatiellia bacterium]HQM22390.1 citrate synthase [Kiritimatiellia bacterium]